MTRQAPADRPAKLLPIPDGLVVLTFDDGCKSNADFVAPLLKRLGFGATFFVNDPPAMPKNWKREHYTTWDQVRQIHEVGFEIGNHTASHCDVSAVPWQDFCQSLELIERLCQEHGIPRPLTFCYPAFRFGRTAVQVLGEQGYLFARRGPFPEYRYDHQGQRGPAYDPRIHHPLLVPTTGFSGPHWGMADLAWAVDQARDGRIAVLCFHGVPDVEHAWVHTDPKAFEAGMQCLRSRGNTVIAMRDLARYVDPAAVPGDPLAEIQRCTEKAETGS